MEEIYNLFAKDKRTNYPSLGAVEGGVESPSGEVSVKPATVSSGVRSTVSTNVIRPSGTLVDPKSSTSGIDYLRTMWTSPEDEERLRKASVHRQRILAVGDALRHIGNIYNTVHGAPNQVFNSPSELERARYLQEKSLRDANNLKVKTYEQARAAQEQKQRQFEMNFNYNLMKDAANAQALKDYRDATLKNNADKWRGQLEFNKQKQQATEDRWKRQDAETQRYHKAQTGLGYARLNETKRHNSVVESRRGGSGKGGTLTFRGKNGFYSKEMSAQEANAFYNQAFDTLSNMRVNGKPIIDKDAVAGNVIPGLLGGNKINMQARKEAVDRAIYNYPEAGELLRGQYEFSFDPRGIQEPVQQATKSQNILFGSWHNQPQAISTFVPSTDDDEEDEDLFDDEDLSGISF